MNEHPIDLVAIINVIKKNMKQVITFTLGAMVLAAIVYFIKPKKYEGKTECYVINPMYKDRVNVYTEVQRTYVEIFGNENTVDKVLAMGKSESLIDDITYRLNLYAHHKLKSEQPEDVIKMRETFRSNATIARTEYYTVEISYKDKDKDTAALVANTIVEEINTRLKKVFANVQDDVTNSLKRKNASLDSSIASLTDTLAALRREYNIFSIISPNRSNLIINSAVSSASGNAAFGVEAIQNIESIKDQLVTDRAKNIGVLNEFDALDRSENSSILQPVYVAKANEKPAGLGFILTVLAAGIAVCFLMILFVLLRHFYQLSPNSK